MKLLRLYPDNLDATTDYNLTTNPNCKKMRDAVGQTLTVKALALLEDVSVTAGEVVTFARGEVVTFARVMTDDGDCYGTRSASFLKALTGAWDFADRRECPIMALKVMTGHSKNGRDYLTCDPVYSAE